MAEDWLVAVLTELGRGVGAADVAGLALAQACLTGQRAALVAFERAVLPEVAIALRRLGATLDEVTEVEQRLRIELFVPGEGRRSRLVHFSGRGSLRGWLRAVAAQEYGHLKRRERPSEPLEELADAFLAEGTAPDLKRARAQCQAAFREALEEAVAALPVRERTALRLNAIDGMSIDQLARIYKTHRSTAARWVARARESIEAHVRESLAARLNLCGPELDSVVRLVRDDLPDSLGRMLQK
jgi:RNA polymerase sigma-70 factor (ECF subfamily)